MACGSCIEVSAHSPLARMAHISPPELKNIPCILVTSEAQRETEQEYYRDVVGFPGEFLYAETLFRWSGAKNPSCGITAPSGKRTTPIPTRRNLPGC